MNLTLTLEEEVVLLDKYRLIPNELLFIRILLILQDENNEELFSKYVKILKDDGINLRKLISRLQDKGIILKSYKIPKEGSVFDPFAIPFNKNFIKNLYRSSFELGKELFEAYPQFGNINGNVVPLRGISKHFDSLEDCYFRYSKCIGWSSEKHDRIVSLVTWAKDNNLLNMSLSSFVINNSWLDLEAMRNGDAGNINVDSIRML